MNLTIALGDAKEEFALPLNGRKNNLTRNHFMKYFVLERLRVSEKVLNELISEIQQALPLWRELIVVCFLTPAMKEQYIAWLALRCERLVIIG
jgi:serine/threonine-protein kinase HipA